MNFFLVVIRPFAQFARGHMIEDPVVIESVVAGEHANCTVRVSKAGPLTR